VLTPSGIDPEFAFYMPNYGWHEAGKSSIDTEAIIDLTEDTATSTSKITLVKEDSTATSGKTDKSSGTTPNVKSEQQKTGRSMTPSKSTSATATASLPNSNSAAPPKPAFTQTRLMLDGNNLMYGWMKKSAADKKRKREADNKAMRERMDQALKDAKTRANMEQVLKRTAAGHSVSGFEHDQLQAMKACGVDSTDLQIARLKALVSKLKE
jgi:hypothetical protein